VLGIVGRDGAHAEYLQLPTRNLSAVPDSVSDEQAVFTEPLAAAHGIMERVNIAGDHNIAVIGDGKLGLLCAMSLALSSKNVTLIGKHPEKIAIAEKYKVKGMTASDIPAASMRQFDIVVEASGSESGFASAVELVKPRGTIVLKSTFHGTPMWPAARIVVDEITIVGSRCGRFAPALDLIAHSDINFEDLIDDRYALADGISAMERASRPGTLKILLYP
jgi:threonine dehydrogenase-like Zn-dependent dehydrogenase